MENQMLQVIVYTKENCSLCEEAIGLLMILQDTYPHVLELRDIYSNDHWLLNYQLTIPVIEVGDQQLNANQINYTSVKELLHESTLNKEP